MPDTPAHDSDRVLTDARRSLVHQREGGRRLPAEAGSIGRRSRELKNRHFIRRIWRMMLGVIGVIVAAMIAGLVVNGIGFTGVSGGGALYLELDAAIEWGVRPADQHADIVGRSGTLTVGCGSHCFRSIFLGGYFFVVSTH